MVQKPASGWQRRDRTFGIAIRQLMAGKLSCDQPLLRSEDNRGMRLFFPKIPARDE
jgi:hypothetical protein